MFIIFGNGQKVLGDVKVHPKCSNCQQTTLVATFIQQYFHLLWIPFFPTGTLFYVTCTNCGSMFDPKQVPGIGADIENKMPKTPKWTFAGLILVAIAGTVLLVTSYFSKPGTIDQAQFIDRESVVKSYRSQGG